MEADTQEAARMMTDKSRSTEEFATLDGLLDAEGTSEAMRDAANRVVLAWQVRGAMKQQRRSRKGLAERVPTRRSKDNGRDP
jgi:hypothetical protein